MGNVTLAQGGRRTGSLDPSFAVKMALLLPFVNLNILSVVGSRSQWFSHYPRLRCGPVVVRSPDRTTAPTVGLQETAEREAHCGFKDRRPSVKRRAGRETSPQQGGAFKCRRCLWLVHQICPIARLGQRPLAQPSPYFGSQWPVILR